MSEPEPRPVIRLGTADRNAALAALDAHMAAGRLDPTEYGDRSARIVEARTADEIVPLFADLPPPHPDLPSAALTGSTTSSVAAGSPPVPAVPDGALQTWGPRIAAAMPVLALVLFFTVPIPHAWVFFLLIPLGGALFGGSRRGPDAPSGSDRDQRRDERRERGHR